MLHVSFCQVFDLLPLHHVLLLISSISAGIVPACIETGAILEECYITSAIRLGDVGITVDFLLEDHLIDHAVVASDANCLRHAAGHSLCFAINFGRVANLVISQCKVKLAETVGKRLCISIVVWNEKTIQASPI